MICPRCSLRLSGETALIGEPMCAAYGYGDDYVLLVSCPHCHATRGIRVWQSEAAAVDDWLEMARERDGIAGLISDEEPILSSERDSRIAEVA